MKKPVVVDNLEYNDLESLDNADKERSLPEEDIDFGNAHTPRICNTLLADSVVEWMVGMAEDHY